MRLKRSPPFLYFCVLVQVTWAQPRNDHPRRSWNSNSNNALETVKLRHNNAKFPHFEELKTRIAELNSGAGGGGVDSRNRLVGGSDTSSSRFSGSSYNNKFGTDRRLRHHGWSSRYRSGSTTTTTTSTTTPMPEDDLFYNYGELEGDDQTEDDRPDDIFDTSVNDDDIVVDYDSFQAEEPTSTTTIGPRTYSSLSEYKWEQLGTMERVQQARHNYIHQKDAGTKKSSEGVVEHYIRVKNTGQCKNPIPKVIPVHLEHPDPSVTYMPHCTVLHRCAEDTGCCRYDSTCQYKERVQVTLYFYVKPIGGDVAKVEKLTFFNHTECECKEKPEETVSHTTERQKRVAVNGIRSRPNYESNTGNNFSAKTTIAANNGPESLLIKCKCPKEFVPKIKRGSKCHCDCDADNEDCQRMKKGKEYNSLVDRLCVQKRECGIINCEYGPYNKLKGRCPRYDEP